MHSLNIRALVYSSLPIPALTVLQLTLPHYLSVQASQGLVMTRILLNSPSLFRKGLPGLNLVLPSFLAALELVLPHPAPLVRLPPSSDHVRVM